MAIPNEAPKRNYVGRVTKQCEHCGMDVNRRASHFKEHVFCSKKCYGASTFYAAHLRANNARIYADSRRREPCLMCGVIVDKPRSLMTGKRTFCSVPCMRAYAVAVPVRQVTAGGYVKVFVGRDFPGAIGSGHMLEHRKVMQVFLGRPLTKDENVHHVNGVRDDNRLGNLELWSHSQPKGQRVADKVQWAHEFLALYEGTSFYR
jgi:endogenous inhibitor of DNA gyrase (YacG/DUF329 family)